MPYCPIHRIRIHAGSRTFVYYDGEDANSKRVAALRNILFEKSYFDKYILGNKQKAETHRFCNETSEDALTWNVFSRLAREASLARLLSHQTAAQQNVEPELYQWGLRIDLRDQTAPEVLPALTHARERFERGIAKFLTEPDIMLYVPGRMLVVIEAKFTSGNSIATNSAAKDLVGQKPKSCSGILNRYSIPPLLGHTVRTSPTSEPFYSLLYRNLVYAIFMAQELGVPWTLLSLVTRSRFGENHRDAGFRDPTPFVRSVLPESSDGGFRLYSWEELYADHVANVPELNDLGNYIYDKSANGTRAFGVSGDVRQERT